METTPDQGGRSMTDGPKVNARTNLAQTSKCSTELREFKFKGE